MHPRTPTLLLVVALVGCDGETLRNAADPVDDRGVPRIEVTPDAFDAGELLPGAFRDVLVTAWSRGPASLAVEEVWIDGDPRWALQPLPELPLTLDLDGRLPMRLRLEAEGGPLEQSELVIASNDPDRPEVRVPLNARFLLPSLSVSPSILAFGEVLVECERELAFALANVGDAPLTLTTVALEGESQVLLSDLPPDGVVLAPGESLPASVLYRPTAATPVTAALRVVSDDPEQPEVARAVAGEGVDREWMAQVFETPVPADAVDVLFVVDNSCSMSDEQGTLGDDFAAYADALLLSGADFRLAATTTDLGDFGALVGAPSILDPSTPNLSATFAANLDLGTGGSPLEQGFEPAALALDAHVGSSDFLREGAVLQVLFVSDEPEQSDGSVESWVSTLSGYRPTPSDTTLSAITGQGTGCSGEGGSALAAPRYQEAVEQTGGVSASICAGDWSGNLETLAASALMGSAVMELQAVPEVETIALTVDGASWPDDRWTWSAPENGVRLLVPFPEPGAEIQITYRVAEGCGG